MSAGMKTYLKFDPIIGAPDVDIVNLYFFQLPCTEARIFMATNFETAYHAAFGRQRRGLSSGEYEHVACIFFAPIGHSERL